MTKYTKILSADKTELRRIAIQTAELNQKMYAMLDELASYDENQMHKQEIENLLAEARGERK